MSDQPESEPEETYVEMQDSEWSDPSLPNTFPSGATVEADRRDAEASHDAGDIDPPAEGTVPDHVPASVAEAERAANERGANVQGEGQIVEDPPASTTP